MEESIAISFENVTKKYYLQEDKTLKELLPSLLKRTSWTKTFTVFSNLNLEIKKGETIGIVGRNGAGKSTILKLIAGVTSPTKGKVIVNGKVAPLIELGAGFHHELTGLENIYLNAAILGMHKKEVQSQLDNIINFSELGEFINVPVKRYSSGMYMRLGFSVAIHTNAPILLIDEVLAVGDISFQEKCLDYLQDLKKSKTKTIVFVSHNEQAIRNFCERIVLIDHGRVVDDGDPIKILPEYHKLLSK